MIRDITLGQYFPGESVIHRLDPRVKIIATLLFIVELFIVDNFIGFAVAAVYLGAVIAVSKVPLSFIVRGLKPIIVILLFTFALNIFMVDGQIIWQWTDGIERLLSPFKKIGLPAHEIAMMMTIALRFIPTLLEETDKIMKAQQARGADFESGGLIQKAKALIPILVPLFVSAFRIAMDLAMAMESRCYRGGEHRTRMHEMNLHGKDWAAITFMVLFLAVIIIESRIF